jgi:hypothetical protein
LNLFDAVQVGQVVVGENQMVGSTHLRKPVDRETHGLIDADEQVHQQQRPPPTQIRGTRDQRA